MTDVHNVVLVHGGFVDGSGWQGVYDLLTADGFNVSVVQNQTLSLESDVETTTNVLDLQDGPAILVGHSYGGAVITEAGTHDSVAGLVYITAFAPDQGESVNSLIAGFPTDGPQPPILPPQDGIPVPRPRQVRRSLRRGPSGARGGVHGRLAGPMGRRGTQRNDQRPRLAQPAELVSARDRRPNDPGERAAHDGRADRRDNQRGPRQPRHLRLPARCRRQPHHRGGTVPRYGRDVGLSQARSAGPTASCRPGATRRIRVGRGEVWTRPGVTRTPRPTAYRLLDGSRHGVGSKLRARPIVPCRGRGTGPRGDPRPATSPRSPPPTTPPMRSSSQVRAQRLSESKEVIFDA